MMGREQQERLIALLRKLEDRDAGDANAIEEQNQRMWQFGMSEERQQEQTDVLLLLHMGWIESKSYGTNWHQTWSTQGIYGYELSEDGESVLDLWDESNNDVDELDEPQRTPHDRERPLVMLVHGSSDGVVPPIVDTIRLWCFEQGMDAYKAADHPNYGRFVHTKVDDVIEDSDYYVVVLTPDEELKSGIFRSRPNPMIEMGRLLALDASRVCVLKHEKVEMPSDYAGLVTEPLNDWKSVLMREMKKAGLL